MTSLPLLAYTLVKSGLNVQIERGFAAAAFLLVLVLALFAMARVLGGRGPGQLSARQARRARRASARDLARFESRQAAAAASPPNADGLPS